MTAPIPALVRSPLSDGQWHRMHPLTPLLRGGLALLVGIGIVIANLRERLFAMVLPLFGQGPPPEADSSGDPIDWVVANNQYVLVALGVLALLIVIVVGFALGWRFHTFRITGDDVEVRSGILFRSHRRAPLDRVQGVNLTRPFLARLLGLAKLEVVGAGAAGNVKLEYLRVGEAETVRADILRLASGRALAAGGASNAAPAAPRSAGLRDTVAQGITGIVEGDEPEVEPASVVVLPASRLVFARLLHPATIAAVVLLGGAIGVGFALDGLFWLVIAGGPGALALLGYQVRTVLKYLRFGVASTPDGVRITSGLLTTVTEIVPPGRVHAVQVSQPLLWRPLGWWSVRITRLQGKSSSSSNEQPTQVLPVGTAADVIRVILLLLPDLDPAEIDTIVAAGTRRRSADDPVVTTPRRAWFLQPLSWWRTGYLRTSTVLTMRHGVIWRSLDVVPFARMQSIALRQGPVARMARVAGVQVHTVAGPVRATLSAVDRDGAISLWQDTALAAVEAAAADRSHRWASGDADPGQGMEATDAP